MNKDKIELEFNQWLLEEYLLEMVRAASPEESADWLKHFLQRASQSSNDWLRINAPYWLQTDHFNNLLSKVLLHKINVFNTDQEVVRKNIHRLMVQELQKDVGFGSRRNIEYARSRNKEPEVALHPAYGTNIAYKRPLFGWRQREPEMEIDPTEKPLPVRPRLLRGPHQEEVKRKISDSMMIAKNKALIKYRPEFFDELKKHYIEEMPGASDTAITAAALRDLKKYVRIK